MRFFRTVLAGTILALSVVVPVMAASLEDAVLAYRRADYATAFQVYRFLADQGLAVAQFNLGLMYANGQGVSKDETEAMRWYRLAADQGRSDAQYQLGHLSISKTSMPRRQSGFASQPTRAVLMRSPTSG
jgi:uncharacterized protein